MRTLVPQLISQFLNFVLCLTFFLLQLVVEVENMFKDF